MPFYVYILRSEKNGKYYIGSTNDLNDRFKRHNEGRSKYIKPGIPWQLMYFEEYPDSSKTIKREKEIKNRKSKEFIESLIKTSQD